MSFATHHLRQKLFFFVDDSNVNTQNLLKASFPNVHSQPDLYLLRIDNQCRVHFQAETVVVRRLVQNSHVDACSDVNSVLHAPAH